VIATIFAPASLVAGVAQTAVVIVSREEIHDGKLYDVFLAPPCSERRAICEPWERGWGDGIQVLPGNVVTPEGLVLREKRNA
jgi:hypothetical protein